MSCWVSKWRSCTLSSGGLAPVSSKMMRIALSKSSILQMAFSPGKHSLLPTIRGKFSPSLHPCCSIGQCLRLLFAASAALLPASGRFLAGLSLMSRHLNLCHCVNFVSMHNVVRTGTKLSQNYRPFKRVETKVTLSEVIAEKDLYIYVNAENRDVAAHAWIDSTSPTAPKVCPSIHILLALAILGANNMNKPQTWGRCV